MQQALRLGMPALGGMAQPGGLQQPPIPPLWVFKAKSCQPPTITWVGHQFLPAIPPMTLQQSLWVNRSVCLACSSGEVLLSLYFTNKDADGDWLERCGSGRKHPSSHPDLPGSVITPGTALALSV